MLDRGLGVLAALLGARLVLDGLTASPRDWDSLAYHLPLMDYWLRNIPWGTPSFAQAPMGTAIFESP